jgi:DNA-binding beta-propeller fold protein YncE
MYGIGSNLDRVAEYNLNTAWNVATATLVHQFSVAAQESNPQDLYFRDDGAKMYIVGAGVDRVQEYDLSTAWNVNTSVFVQNFSVNAQDTFPTGLFFKDDGTKMFVVGTIGDDVNEYNLSIAWNVATATYTQNLSVATQELTPQGIYFKPDGTRMYMVGATYDAVWAYDL